MLKHRVWMFATIAVGLTAVGLAGCSGDKNVSTPPTTFNVSQGATTSSSLSTVPSAAASGTVVTVIETEYHLAFSTTTFTAGKYTFTAENKGAIVHALAITGPGVAATTASLNPGQSANLAVTLQAGSYDVFCPIPGHKALGMDQEITVSGSGQGSEAAPTSAPTVTTVPSRAAVGKNVTVTETEFHLGFSTTKFAPGAYTFTAENKGKIVHALAITGPGVAAATKSLNPGQSAKFTVTLKAGSYDVFCPIPGHKALGMNQEITVSG